MNTLHSLHQWGYKSEDLAHEYEDLKCSLSTFNDLFYVTSTKIAVVYIDDITIFYSTLRNILKK